MLAPIKTTSFFICLGFFLTFSTKLLAQPTDLPAFQQRRILLPGTTTDATRQQKEFSEALCNIQNVETVEMTGHLFTSLPPCIAKFGRTLRELRLSNNKLVTLPDAIGALVFMESLDLSTNGLVTLPAKAFEARKLRSINLSSNQITTLPDSIGAASSLEVIDLSQNQISALPDTFAGLTSLRVLNLSKNKITKAPKVFPYLINLTELDISSNSLPVSEQEVIKAIFKDTKVVVRY